MQGAGAYGTDRRGRLIRLAVALGAGVIVIAAAAYSDAHGAELDANGNGVVRSHKTNAHARVSPRFAPRFQAYINDLEAHGAVIRFMGGYRKGRCSTRHMHPCGQALDVCQLKRGVVDRRCHLPSRRSIAAIAARHGLFEGGRWCDSDYGHAQIGGNACGAHRHLARHKHQHYAAAGE